jgi:hypothetical protein
MRRSVARALAPVASRTLRARGARGALGALGAVGAVATLVAASGVVVVGITDASPALAAPAPTTWCGPAESPTDRPDTIGGAQVHVVYAYPADGADDFGRWVTPIARDMESIDSWWRGQDPTRTPRFDLADFPGCDTTFGQLDISSVRLPNPAAHYAVDEMNVISVLAADLRATFASPLKKYLVYYDGPVASGAICGRGIGGPSPGASAVMYLQSDAPCTRAGGGIGAPGGAFSAYLAVHELIHTLDDGPDAGPHRCEGDPGRHYCDDPADVMAPTANASSRLATAVLDAGHDDYYGTGNPSDLRASPYLSHLDAPTVRLTATVTTPGGLVISDVPSISCPGLCALPYDAGTSVRLVATPDPGYGFAGWSAGCTGLVPSCTTMLAADTIVSARFGRPGSVRLRVSGAGSVGGCARSCTRSVVAGQDVDVRAIPRRSQRFVRWEGACWGSDPECVFTAVPGASVKAVFTAR